MRYRTRTLIVFVGAAVVCASVVIANDAKTQVFFGFDAPARKEATRQKGARTIKIFPHNIPRYDEDRKSTRLNSSLLVISYAVFCLKKKNKKNHVHNTTQHNQQP